MPELGESQERRSDRRIQIDQRINGTLDWLSTLDEQVKSGKLTPEKKNEIIARSMIAREVIRERAEDKSRKDGLTGLLNRRSFDEDFEKSVKNGESFGLLIMDIDRFKKVNDTYGHPAGDSVLIQTAQFLNANLREERKEGENDQIYRIGGEEIGMILKGLGNEEDLERVADRLRISIERSEYLVTTNGVRTKIPITLSIGGGVYRNGRQDFIEKVDQGLYIAKDTGRNKTVIIPA